MTARDRRDLRRRPAADRRHARGLVADHRAQRRRGHRADRVRAGPDRLRPDHPRRRRRGARGSSSRRTPTDDERAVTEINSGIYVFDARRAARRPRPSSTTDNAQGELYLTDVVGVARRPAAAVAAPPDRRPLADRGRQRPGPAGPHERASSTAGSCALDARRRDRRRPGHHLDRRRRRPRRPTSRCCPTLAAGRDLGRGGRDASAPTPRWSTPRWARVRQ